MGAADFLMQKKESSVVRLLPHNEKLYTDIIQSIEAGYHSIFYSQGTGLGKSFIFMKLVNEYFTTARVLYIVPKNAIWKNMTHYKEFDYIVDRVTLATFTTFNTYPNKTISCADYDVVFVDECHHMLSDTQGKNVKQFLDDMVSWDKYVFGMTATPEINGVYVDEECFETSCYGLDIFEAIEHDLMPKMDIAVGIREEIDIPNNLREKYSIVGTQTLLDKVLSDYSHVKHWLAYFTTKEELEQNELELRKLFPEYKILKAHTGLDNVDTVIPEFENSVQPVILMSVSMFLEGMHLNNVGGVLLYRNVQKSHTYAQILGRLCSIGQKYTPVIVDVTGSVLSIKQFYIPKSSRAFKGQRKVYDRKDLFDVTSRDYKLFDLMEELRSFNLGTWTEEEDNILREFYSTEGTLVCARLPGRTANACKVRAHILGITELHLWTAEEDAFLREHYPTERSECFKFLPNRTTRACYERVRNLNIKAEEKIVWTEEEEKFLIDNYPIYGSKCFSELQKTESACRGRVTVLGLALKESRAWTAEENAILIEHYPLEGCKCFTLLQDRTAEACRRQVKKLGVAKSDMVKLSPWSKEEEDILIQLYPIRGLSVQDDLPNKTLGQIQVRVKKLRAAGIFGIKRKGKCMNIPSQN